MRKARNRTGRPIRERLRQFASVEGLGETWAHYLHMMDTLATAMSFGLNHKGEHLTFDPFRGSAVPAAGSGNQRLPRFLMPGLN